MMHYRGGLFITPVALAKADDRWINSALMTDQLLDSLRRENKARFHAAAG